MTYSATRRFHKLCLATLVAVYFLVLVGGVVRATGSGMGCPDWPTCFGSLVPPTRVDQLPSDYKEQYAAYRDKKNQKFARFLSAIGMNDTAAKIRSDKSILVEDDFNPSKTWVEYVNRLVGVVIGLLIIALFVVSWPLRRAHRKLATGSLALLILVLFQGWFGSIVVSTNLTPWTVTIHMFLAVVMIALLVWLLVRSGAGELMAPASVRPWALFGIIALTVQIFLGTEVREVLDQLASTIPDRLLWINAAGTAFIVHRSFSWVIMVVLAGIYWKLRKTSAPRASYLVPILLILCSFLTGSAMAYFGVPPAMQPVHLLVAVVAVGWMFQVYLQSVDAPERNTAV